MPTLLRGESARGHTEHMRPDVSRRPYVFAAAAASIFVLTLAALMSQIADGVRSVWPWTAATFPAPPFYYIAAAANVVAIVGALVATRSLVAGGLVEIAAAFVGIVAAFVVPDGVAPGYETLLVSQVLWCSVTLVVATYLIAHGTHARLRTRAGRSLVWV